MSDQVANLFNLSFTTRSFPTLLKTAKIIPTHKKSQNFSLLSNLDKILEKLMQNRL